jgi:competence protein ComEC
VPSPKNVRAKLSRELHVSWFIAFGFIGAVLGIGLSLVLYIGFVPLWIIVANMILLAVFIWRKPRRYAVIFAIIIGLLAGLVRGGWERVEINSYTQFIGRDVVMTGFVSEDPSFGYAGDLRIKLTSPSIDGVELSGTVWASVGSGPKSAVKRSDVVQVSGRLKSGFANFPATLSFAKLDGVARSDKIDLARDMRDSFGQNLETVVKEPESNLGMGILAGQKRALPLDLSEAFKAAGLTHIIVASGYNLTILVRFARRLFARVSRFAAAACASILVLLFACVTGFSPSMTRAAIVAILSLLAWYYGRKSHPVILLFIVAGASALISPYYVWGDAGWYMSFTAFAGVIILSPMIQRYFWGKKKAGIIRQIMVDTFCASICTMPVIAYFMGTIAPFGLIANLLVLPIVPITMLFTFIAGILAIFVPPLAAVFAQLPQILLSYIIKVGQSVADLPYSMIEIGFPVIAAVVCYAIILIFIFYMWRKTKFNFRNNYLVE